MAAAMIGPSHAPDGLDEWLTRARAQIKAWPEAWPEAHVEIEHSGGPFSCKKLPLDTSLPSDIIHCAFLSLPLELRLKVYAFVFQDSILTYKNTYGMLKAGRGRLMINPNASCLRYAIRLTCKRCHAESQQLFYDRTSFCFDYYYGNTFLRPMLSPFFSSIKHLANVSLDDLAGEDDGLEDFPVLKSVNIVRASSLSLLQDGFSPARPGIMQMDDDDLLKRVTGECIWEREQKVLNELVVRHPDVAFQYHFLLSVKQLDWTLSFPRDPLVLFELQCKYDPRAGKLVSRMNDISVPEKSVAQAGRTCIQ